MDWTVFVVSSVLVLAGAIGVILSRNPVHAALSLVMTLFGIAVLFVEQHAHFLAAVQVIVYAGAIVVLFLFVIMFLGVDNRENIEEEPLRWQRQAAVLLAVLALVGLFLLAGGLHAQWATGKPGTPGTGTNIEQLAQVIFTRYLFPFEVTSVLLVIAVVGAVVLARRTAGRDTEAEEEVARP